MPPLDEDEEARRALDSILSLPRVEAAMTGYGPCPHTVQTLRVAGCERFVQLLERLIDSNNRACTSRPSATLTVVDFEHARAELEEGLRQFRAGRINEQLPLVTARLSERSSPAYRAFTRACRRLGYLSWSPVFSQALQRLAPVCLAAIEAEYRVTETTAALARLSKDAVAAGSFSDEAAVMTFCPKCGGSQLSPSWNHMVEGAADMSQCALCLWREPTEGLPTEAPAYPIPTFAWFDTGDGIDGPLEALLLGLPEGPAATAQVEILDAGHLATYRQPGVLHVVTADLLLPRGEIARDRYVWSPERFRRRLRRIQGVQRFDR